jgi:hypothetical protein
MFPVFHENNFLRNKWRPSRGFAWLNVRNFIIISRITEAHYFWFNTDNLLEVWNNRKKVERVKPTDFWGLREPRDEKKKNENKN